MLLARSATAFGQRAWVRSRLSKSDSAPACPAAPGRLRGRHRERGPRSAPWYRRAPSMTPQLPPCCSSCTAYEPSNGGCVLLGNPTVENRRQLLTMPCHVERLLHQRFRSQSEDVARDAIVAFLRPDWPAQDIARSLGRLPRDARIWLTSWPYYYLGRTAVRREMRGQPVEPPADWSDVAPPADPSLPGRVLRALERVRRIDAIDFAMLLDLLRDRFDAASWTASLGASPATVTDRKHLALYRYWMAFHDVLERVQPHEAAVALATRRLSPGDPTDADAFEITRRSLEQSGAPGVRAPQTMTAWREMYRAGASESLRFLAEHDALGPQLFGELQGALRRVLRVS